jgi:2-hydroxychromene-2-carboxylate isomerase
MDEYRNYCYANYASVLSQTSMSLDDFIPWWTAQVAVALNLDQTTLESLYGPDDPYNTNHSTRDQWKFATASGVFGTPTGFANGVMLDELPFTVEGWMDMLNTIYASQYNHIATQKPS